ncbi:MAG: ArsR family transcriptional regulator [Candidatus Bathyarchaeota archaeon]|nr:ArsR family transcriptional regulator [Candidatus Bathyarchaeota archaeon]
MIIKDPEVAKLFADETRRRMLHMLGRNEQSTTDLAKALEKTHSSIIHHLNFLKEAGLVDETRTEKIRNMVQTFYRSTARRFLISYSLGETLDQEGQDIPWQESTVQYLMDGLHAFGLTVPDENTEKVRRLLNTYFLRDQKAYEETLEQQKENIKLRKFQGYRIMGLLKHLKLSEDPEYNVVVGELRELLKPDASDGSE